MRHLWLATSIVALATYSCHAAPLSNVVVPDSQTTVEGNFNNLTPFGDSVPNYRYQQVYGASAFAVGEDAVKIKAIAFRSDGQFGRPFELNFPSIQIKLSTTSAMPDGLSQLFPENVGANEQLVFDGPLRLSSANPGPQDGPKEFDIAIVFQTPFTYAASVGNLLLDVQTSGRTVSELVVGILDAQNAIDDAVSRVWGAPAGAEASSDLYPSLGLVTKFIIVPEPPSIALLLLMLSSGLQTAACAPRCR